jgi:hypothetical protein
VGGEARLAPVGEVRASGRAFDRQQPGCPVGHRHTVRIEYGSPETGYHLPGGARPRLVVGSRKDDVQRLCATDAVDEMPSMRRMPVAS